MSDNEKHKVLTIPILLVMASVLLPYLLPTPNIFERVLDSYFQKIYLIWIFKCSIILLIFSLAYWFYLNPKVKGKRDEKELIKFIEENIATKYALHTKELSINFDEILNKYASRGFSIPPGPMAGDISDLYINEIAVYSNMLGDLILDVDLQAYNQTCYQEIIVLIEELISKKNSEIMTLYDQFAINYYKNHIDEDHFKIMQKFFSRQINTETELRTNELKLKVKSKWLKI